jgi:hypothetical protein
MLLLRYWFVRTYCIFSLMSINHHLEIYARLLLFFTHALSIIFLMSHKTTNQPTSQQKEYREPDQVFHNSNH